MTLREWVNKDSDEIGEIMRKHANNGASLSEVSISGILGILKQTNTILLHIYELEVTKVEDIFKPGSN